MEKFDDLLTGLDRFQNLFPHRSLFDPGDQILGHAEFHVSLQQRNTDFTQRIGDVFIGNFTDPAEIAEGLVEAVAEG